MKTIGLIGGMSWESSLEYYRIINEVVKETCGGLHSAKCIMYSVNFEEVVACQRAGEWDVATKILAEAAQSLEKAGADFFVICTNTMHKIASDVQAAVNIPLLHIADVTVEKIKEQGKKKVGLIATKYTMEHDFYISHVKEKGIDVIVPNETDRDLVHSVIFQELCVGVIHETSKREYKRIMQSLVDQGAEAIILGCTEIMLLISEGDASVPLFDTTRIHAEEAAKFSLVVTSAS